MATAKAQANTQKVKVLKKAYARRMFRSAMLDPTTRLLVHKAIRNGQDVTIPATEGDGQIRIRVIGDVQSLKND